MHNQKIKINIGIVGATGYTGVELLRILANHPYANVVAVTSRQEAGKKISDLFPNLRSIYDLCFSTPESAQLNTCDAVFFATPNGVAIKEAPALLEAGVKVIDLSADYRIKNVAIWEEWYQQTHPSPFWLKQAVYGLPELNRDEIKNAQLIANPGCYPTAVTLALLPLLQQGYLKYGAPIIADCKSGVSGSGRKSEIGTLMCEAGDNFKAYAVEGHRHLPEIKQTIKAITGTDKELVFVPHLAPMIRGMHATLYVELNADIDVHELYLKYYQENVFVDVLPTGTYPETRSVRGANLCRISIQKAPQSNVWVIMSVIDNLVKGAAGQAVQNMNIISRLPENIGLNIMPLLP